MNSYYEDVESNSQLGVHGPPLNLRRNQDENDSSRKSCSRKTIQNCFSSTISPAYTNNSCLYRRFVAKPEPETTTKSQSETSTVFLRQYVQNESPVKVGPADSLDLVNNKNSKYQTREANEGGGGEVTNKLMSDSVVWKNFTVEDSITAITIGVAVVFLLSTISLFIGVYLIYKRKSFVYHAANNDSGYPNDER